MIDDILNNVPSDDLYTDDRELVASATAEWNLNNPNRSSGYLFEAIDPLTDDEPEPYGWEPHSWMAANPQLKAKAVAHQRTLGCAMEDAIALAARDAWKVYAHAVLEYVRESLHNNNQ